MKFERIDFNSACLSVKDYRFVKNSERYFDAEYQNKLMIDKGVNWTDDQFDIFYDGFEPICKGDDGKLYSVLFVNDKAFIWQEVEKLNN